MIRISHDAKQAIIKKVLSKNGQTVAEIAKENNIGKSTLGKWVKRCKVEHSSAEDNQSLTADMSSSTLVDRFKHLQATFGQDSVMVGAYCRKHGLYPHQLTQWEADFMKTPDHSKQQMKINSEVKELRAENKALNQIIARKDKVLAETVALLVLKKKAAHIWGDSEED
jgi:transposase-like protein